MKWLSHAVRQLSRLASSRGQTRPANRGRRRRLEMEVLEDRRAPSFIGGSVYDDLNNNGVRDPGEPGIAGSTLLLNAPDGHNGATARPADPLGQRDMIDYPRRHPDHRWLHTNYRTVHTSNCGTELIPFFK